MKTEIPQHINRLNVQRQIQSIEFYWCDSLIAG